MKIPEKIKIGGLTYTVEITENLKNSMFECCAEISHRDLVIRIYPQSQQKMELDFWHEVVHAMYNEMGLQEQDERDVESLAQILYTIIVDNPEIFVSGK